jgi:two-component system, NarL family, nitrate/nitrite response regulator NarL
MAPDDISASALFALLAENESLEPVSSRPTSDNPATMVFGPDVILSDLGWSFRDDEVTDADASTPELGLLEGIPVLGLAADVALATQAWRSGYRSLLLRSESPRALVSALHATAAGLWVLSAQLASALTPTGSPDLPTDFEALTPREQQVLSLLAEGLTNRGIARRLNISDHTVKFHVNAILGKLGAESRTDAVVRATRAGLILL